MNCNLCAEYVHLKKSRKLEKEKKITQISRTIINRDRAKWTDPGDMLWKSNFRFLYRFFCFFRQSFVELKRITDEIEAEKTRKEWNTVQISTDVNNVLNNLYIEYNTGDGADSFALELCIKVQFENCGRARTLTFLPSIDLTLTRLHLYTSAHTCVYNNKLNMAWKCFLFLEQSTNPNEPNQTKCTGDQTDSDTCRFIHLVVVVAAFFWFLISKFFVGFIDFIQPFSTPNFYFTWKMCALNSITILRYKFWIKINWR